MYSSGGVDGSNCCSESIDPMLDLLPDLYSKLNIFLYKASGTLIVHLTLSTDYLYYQLLF